MFGPAIHSPWHITLTMNDSTPQESVFAAAIDGNLERVMELIDAVPTLLNATNARKNTPLVFALDQRHLDLAQALIERGANVFVVDHSDYWAMRYIVERNSLRRDDRVRLVEAAIGAGVWDSELFHAVWRRDHARAKQILAEDPAQASIKLADRDGEDGFRSATLPYCGLSPLHYAVLAGDKRMTRVLLEAGAEVDAVPHGQAADSPYTPMTFVRRYCEDIAQMLVDFGANVRHSTSYLSSASKAVRKVVIANGGAGTPLLTALCLKDMDKAAEIVRNDASAIHDRLEGAYVDTPLHMAVRAQSVEVIQALVAQGMDVDTPSSGGYTALAMASELYAPLNVFKALVELGADVRVDGDAPIYGAIWQHVYRHWDYESVIRYLAAQGSRPKGAFHCGHAGNLKAAKLLVELGADVNETSDDDWPCEGSGFTALDYCTGVAGDQQSPRLAKFLREHGGMHASELKNSQA